MNHLIKHCLHGVCLMLVLVPALLSGMGKVELGFLFFAQALALVPGILGDYLRIAYYKLTLDSCALHSRVQFGSFFAHPQAKVGRGVYIGSYCVLGRTSIGDRTQIASGVQILSGRQQHGRDKDGRILGAEQGEFHTVSIGQDCWIGAAAIVMADVGAGSTVGAGAVVVKSVPPQSVVVRNPAKPIRSASAEAE